MSSSPQKTLANLVAFATVAGIILWRENHWRSLLPHAGSVPAVASSGAGNAGTAFPEASVAPTSSAFPDSPPSAGGTDAALLEQNALLQRQLVAKDGEMRNLQVKVAELQAAVEAAKPPPTPDDLVTKFTGQRGLTFDPPVQLTPAPVETILGKIRESALAALPEASAQARSRAAVALGLTSDPFDYREAMASLAAMTSGGFYQHDANTLFYREEASLLRADGREMFISALAPALLRQHFPLARSNQYDTPDDDAAIAAMSLFNGDANSSRVRFGITDQMALNLDRAGTPAPAPSSSSAPPYLTEIWKFSQDKGSLFAEAVIGKGGLPALNEAYARPPRSTSEILHPETLYLGATPFEPVKITLPQPANVAGADPAFTNIAGEFGTYIVLRGYCDVDTATVAAEGWMGDRYAVWAGPEGKGDHLFWKTAWQSPQDTREFFDALRSTLMQRFTIPWRAEYDAAPGQFTVRDPHRVIRLTMNPEAKTVTLQNSTAPDFADALEKTAAAW